MKNLYRNKPYYVHPRNRLTYQNIVQMKRAIQARRRPNNNTSIVNENNINFTTSNGHRIALTEIPTSLKNYPLASWNIIKILPNGRKIEYMTGAFNNDKPINLNKMNVGFMAAKYNSLRPRNEAALTIQRAWRARKQKGPFNNPIMKSILQTHIIPKLPKKNKASTLAAFRKPTSLNINMIERSRKVDPYWKALLNNKTRRSVLQHGSTEWLTNIERKRLGHYGLKKIELNPATLKWEIPVNKRESAWTAIRTMRSRGR